MTGWANKGSCVLLDLRLAHGSIRLTHPPGAAEKEAGVARGGGDICATSILPTLGVLTEGENFKREGAYISYLTDISSYISTL